MPNRSSSRSDAPFYDDYAALFDRYTDVVDHLYGRPLREWISTHLPASGERAVDLGCGAGRLTPLLAERFGQVIGVDVSSRMLEIARSRRSAANISYQNRGIEEVTADTDGLFDAVLSVSALYLLNDYDAALGRIRKLVRPGGTALLVDIVADPGNYASRARHRAFAYRETAQVLLGRRSVSDATTVWRLRTHPRWLDQVTSAPPLDVADFEATYRNAFPGVSFARPHPLVRAASWTA
ncbi:MAG: class I SAM-dependent methyltransferase [Frankia sp.]